MSSDDALVERYRTLVPDHDHIAPELIHEFIGVASSLHSPAAFGARFELAMIYFAAHFIEITPGLGSRLPQEVGAVVMQADGSVSSQFSVPMESDRRNAWLAQSQYGNIFLAITAGLAATKPIFIGLEELGDRRITN